MHDHPNDRLGLNHLSKLGWMEDQQTGHIQTTQTQESAESLSPAPRSNKQTTPPRVSNWDLVQSQLRTLHDNLDKHFTETVDDREDLAKQVESLNQALQQNQECIITLENTAGEKQLVIEDLAQQLANSKEVLSQLAEYKDKYQSLSQRVENTLRPSHEKLRQDNKNLALKAKQSEHSFVDLKQAHSTLKQKFTNFNERIKKQLDELATNKSQQQQLITSLQASKLQAEKKLSALTQIKAENETYDQQDLQNQVDTLSENNNRLERQIQRAKEIISQLNDERYRLNQSMESLQQKSQHREQSNHFDNHKAEVELKELKQQYQKALNQIQTKGNANANLRLRISEQSDEFQTRTQELLEITNSHKQQVKQLNEDLFRMRREHLAKEGQFESQLREINFDNRQLSEGNNKSEQHALNLKAQNQDLLDKLKSQDHSHNQEKQQQYTLYRELGQKMSELDDRILSMQQADHIKPIADLLDKHGLSDLQHQLKGGISQLSKHLGTLQDSDAEAINLQHQTQQKMQKLDKKLTKIKKSKQTKALTSLIEKHTQSGNRFNTHLSRLMKEVLEELEKQRGIQKLESEQFRKRLVSMRDHVFSNEVRLAENNTPEPTKKFDDGELLDLLDIIEETPGAETP